MIDRDEYYTLANSDCVAVAKALGMVIDNSKQTTEDAIHIRHSGGLYIFPLKNNWYRHSDGKKGFPIDLVMDKLACSKEDALKFIKQNVTSGYSPSPFQQSKPPFVLPGKTFPERVRCYLIDTRGIDPAIVDHMIKKGAIAEDAVHHNCMFIGFDKSGKERSCALRGTSGYQFRGEVSGGDKSYSFAIQGKSNKLRVYESPIDAMSNATFAKLLGKDWLADHRLSANGCGHTAIFRYLNEYPKINEVTLSLDNDSAGRKATELLKKRIHSEFGNRITKIQKCFPDYKDWNEELQQFRAAQKQDLTVHDFFDIINELSTERNIYSGEQNG